MKKLNKLFAILFAVLGVTTLKAQTDVTSQYLSNADFEGEYQSAYAVNTTANNGPRHIFLPEGWDIDYVNKSTFNITILESTDAMASNFSGTYAVSADNNRYMVRFRDNQPTEYVDLSQTITIKETGKYTFSAEMIREDGSKVNVELYAGETSVSNSKAGTWETRSFTIPLSAGDEVKVGLKFTNKGAGGTKLGADNVKIAFEPIDVSELSWTAPVVGVNLKDVNDNTELYMYNVKADAFAASGMSWGTHAIVKELQNGDSKLSADVHRCRVSKPTDGQLQIMLNERTYLGGDDVNGVNGCWVDNGSANNKYIYNEVSTNVYTLQLATATDKYLDCSWAYGGHITFNNGYGNTEWAFVLRSDITSGKYLLYKAKKEMYDIYTALVEAGHEETYAEALALANAAYTDANATAATVNAATKKLLSVVAPALSSKYFTANSLFNNPDMRGYGDDTDWGNGLNAFNNGIFESYHSSETITQKQTGLPNGFYTVEFIGIYRQDGGDAAPTLTLTSGSNSAKANLKALTEIDFGNCSGDNKWTGANKPDDMYSAGEALAHTDANVKVENFFVENGELTITMAMPSANQWLLCQGFQIYFKAESLEQYANLFREALAAAETIDANTLNTYAKGVLSTALGNAASEQVDKDWYQARTAELNDAVALANAVVAPYADAKALFTICENIQNNSQEFVEGAETAFSSAVNTAKTDVESAETADAINAVYNTLETARQTYVQQADPLNGTAFDYTFKVTNPGFDNGKTGWESTGGAQNKAIATNKANGIITGTFYENWNPSNFTGEIYQKISNLPSGIYKLKVAAYGAGTNVYANDKQTAVTTGDGAWYEVDQVIVGDGTLKFGIKNENATTWMGIDNASIYYYGFDVATAQASVSELKAKAEAIVTEAKPMNADIATALNAAIADADATKDTRKELSPMIDALSSAVADAEASIADYEKIAQYIDKADNIDASIAAGYKSQYENGSLAETAISVFQNLEVATYDYVTENFKYTVPLSSTWNSTGTNTSAKEFNNEHWSGETRGYMNQNDDNGQGWNASAWSLDFDQDVTLPAGEYVFKVAGRKSADATLELVVTMGETILGTVEDFPNGSTGLGINKAGEASFDPNDAFTRNENTGFGWQWRYVRFVLDTEATVKVAVHAEANLVKQWVSFGDYTLQMTEETYLAANMHGLDAPTAAAEALVGIKPMGTAENDALQAALDMPVTTGAELLAKIDALNTAVANAKAWIPLYNEAKAPLVAALERFEADFNLGDGLHGYMKEGLWANVLDQVQAAAVAKDVTDRYEGFANAADNLNTALDAAQASINMYANLAAEISYAKAYSPVVTENTDGHTAAIEVAQAAYDAAEIDDASALILGMQNYRALDYIHITENYTEEVKLGGWTGKTNSGSGEHWSGDKEKTYFDYSKWASGNTNGANEATQTITLPAGKYVLMAAGRAATVAGTEAYIKVNDTKVNFAAKGSYGYGIATDGAANYAAEGTYGRDNEGYGWEYRFITFTLTEESEVTLTAGMTIDVNTADLSWAGVCAPVLYKQEAIQVNLAISAVEWATLILPFDAELPNGVKAYSCGKVDGDDLVLEEAANFVANTPYLVNGAEGTYSFEGYSIAEEDSYTVGLFTGTYVDYQTEVGTNTYVLQKNNNGGAAFFLVGEEAQPWVRAYHCYMTYEDAAGAPMFSISRGDDTTGIENATLNAQPSTVIYDLMGRKVTTMVKGGMYIVNGKKVVIK